MIELKIPTTYEDITLAEYMEMQKSLQGRHGNTEEASSKELKSNTQ